RNPEPSGSSLASARPACRSNIESSLSARATRSGRDSGCPPRTASLILCTTSSATTTFLPERGEPALGQGQRAADIAGGQRTQRGPHRVRPAVDVPAGGARRGLPSLVPQAFRGLQVEQVLLIEAADVLGCFGGVAGLVAAVAKRRRRVE